MSIPDAIWPTTDMRLAFRALMHMDENERAQVLCWFCADCHRYVGPGDACRCTKQSTTAELAIGYVVDHNPDGTITTRPSEEE